MIRRTLFDSDHEIFRDSVRRFIEKEITPYHAMWEEKGIVPRDVWLKAGQAGLLCCNISSEYGGAGADFLFNVVVIEELSRAGATGPGFYAHSDMVATYLERFASEQLKQRWLPRMCTGEMIGAIGISEPGAGSDVRNIITRARLDGDTYVISGQKTYISNGQNCDFVILAVKTNEGGAKDAITLLLVEANRKGFVKGQNLKKLGLHAQDTSELFFDEVRVPQSNIVGEPGQGFQYLAHNLAHERLAQAVRSAAVAQEILAQTVSYTSERMVFGQCLSEFQNTQFKLAELKSAITMAQVFTDQCIALQLTGELDPVDAASAKLQLTELHCRVVDECLQLHGGWGYMWEYPVCRAYADARMVKIAGGSSEIMKKIIARSLFPKRTPKIEASA